ncbi:MAG TPA: GNAT family N-acetyltransferase [Chitinophaga sp.]|uniref:GNAT family N-acetyltransferase n=1 Tax=Chitinophaga sp. TaxID=1869181 RepID=UPI002BE93C2A|nr:GNAT family N-acetyltransferase [Chitinophaga sp.]HVI43649.1 GNAT family N-acetyltransferase [Chitinophaga sp.]
MTTSPSSHHVLPAGATQLQLEQSVADNHQELFCLGATALAGEIKTINDITCTYAGADIEAMICFPGAGIADNSLPLDEMMTYYQSHPPHSIRYWSLAAATTPLLNARLLARGFKPSWPPYWMALDLATINDQHSLPEDIQIKVADNPEHLRIKDLPYSDGNSTIPETLRVKFPERTQRFIAVRKEKIIGHSEVFFTTGEYGNAGIYNVGVIPTERGKGVGRAVVIAACKFARQHGYNYAVLNATGQRMYEQIGFRWIGSGATWHIGNFTTSDLPAAGDPRIHWAEAVGTGNLPALKELYRQSPSAIDTPVANGMTLIQLAAHCGQAHTAEWLIEHGARYNVLDVWDLNMKDKAAALLHSEPERVNTLYDDWLQITLLHIAAERNDTALAQLALSAHPDLSIRDKFYKSTPLDWAGHFDRREIIQLIKKYASGK